MTDLSKPPPPDDGPSPAGAPAASPAASPASPVPAGEHPPPAGWTPPPPPSQPPHAAGPRVRPGAALATLGAGAAGCALFGLPIQSFGSQQSIAYVQLHDASQILHDPAQLFGDLGAFWWSWGLLTGGILVLVAVTLLVLGVADEVFGWVTAVLALALGTVHAIALGQSPSYAAFTQFRGTNRSLYDHTSYGTWIGLSGLLIAAIGGVLAGIRGQRRLA